jgi:hypothetical protein
MLNTHRSGTYRYDCVTFLQSRLHVILFVPITAASVRYLLLLLLRRKKVLLTRELQKNWYLKCFSSAELDIFKKQIKICLLLWQILYFAEKCDITLVPSTPSCGVEKPLAPSAGTLVDLLRQIHSTCTSKGFLVEKGGGKCSQFHSSGCEFSYLHAQNLTKSAWRTSLKGWWETWNILFFFFEGCVDSHGFLFRTDLKLCAERFSSFWNGVLKIFWISLSFLIIGKLGYRYYVFAYFFKVSVIKSVRSIS